MGPPSPTPSLSHSTRTTVFSSCSLPPKLPVVLKDFQGRPVFTDRLGSDAVMLLVGRGLTDWLLQDAEHGMFPPPHAVPSLAGTAITDRTVMARMKIAEYN